MSDEYYEIVHRLDGWHVQRVTRVPISPPSSFPTRAAAEEWCRARGGIPLATPGEGAITIAPTNTGIGEDVQDAAAP